MLKVFIAVISIQGGYVETQGQPVTLAECRAALPAMMTSLPDASADATCATDSRLDNLAESGFIVRSK